jgi:hypothetical protein
MNSPNSGLPMKLVETKPHTYQYKGGNYSVGGTAWECQQSGTQYNDMAQTNAFLKAIRKAHKNRPR